MVSGGPVREVLDVLSFEALKRTGSFFSPAARPAAGAAGKISF
jgi:hypothetical protein